ncbi:hypothetical protein HHI36_000898 [Cryptolaemus montrouzieri]|uniref:Cuticle protein CPCFC domain-containing protein n=1 Tax=Cryptolaemus montrouzieri TaxID=559131 RepID=A0ABD2P6D1_9CUCU
MLSKLVMVALFLAVANSAYTGPFAGNQPASQFPAGVDPQSCPNYPVCENPSVAVNQVPVSAYTSQYQPAQFSQPQYAQPQYSQQYNPAAIQAAQYQLAQADQTQSRYTSSPTQQYNLAQQAPVQLQQRQYNLAQFTPNQAYNAVPQQQYAAQQSRYPANVQAALDRGDYIGDGDYHGEGLTESGAQAQSQAYNPAAYQQAYANQVPQQAYQAASQQVAYQGVQQPAQLPAGLAPGACPNYPFCHQ